MTVGGMGFIPERLLMMMISLVDDDDDDDDDQLGSINNASPNRSVHGFFRP